MWTLNLDRCCSYCMLVILAGVFPFLLLNYLPMTLICLFFGKSVDELQAKAKHKIVLLSERFAANKVSLSLNKFVILHLVPLMKKNHVST